MVSNQHSSYGAFMHKLIDYAGLFPPTQLPFDKAVKNYANYIKDQESWILGPFVHPASNLERLNEFVPLFSESYKLRISATGKKTSSFDELIEVISNELSKMNSFCATHKNRVKIEAYELPLPPLIPKKEDLKNIAKVINEKRGDIKVFLEPTFPLSDDWNSLVDSTLAIIASHNAETDIKQNFSSKLRTGHVQAELIPSTEKVASFISTCRDYKIAMKFTAGLHHPIRMYRDEIQDKMHGFVNIFTAGIMAHIHELSKDAILEILNTEKSFEFSFEDNALYWGDMPAKTEEIDNLRRYYLCSYGSCNFEEPIEELNSLNVIKKSK